MEWITNKITDPIDLMNDTSNQAYLLEHLGLNLKNPVPAAQFGPRLYGAWANPGVWACGFFMGRTCGGLKSVR